MTWVRTDDQAPHHPKLVKAGAEACWLWQCGLCYANAHHLDGLIPKSCLPALYAPLAIKAARLAIRLVDVGLWHDTDGGYLIHDYEHFQGQALKEEVEARREYERDRKRKQRASKFLPFVPDIVPDNQGSEVPDIQLNVPSVPSVTRVGARASRPHPDPSRPEEEREPGSGDPVFEHWVKVMGRDPSRTKLNAKRREKLRARRREGYSDEMLCRAVDGCSLSEFHMGKNDRGEKYNDLDTILKDGTTVEKHAARAEERRPKPENKGNGWRPNW